MNNTMETTKLTKAKQRVTSERGDIGESFMIVIAILIAVVLMVIFPLMTVADRNDDVSQLAVQAAASDFVEKVRTTGRISQANYSELIETLTATGNTYDVNMTLQVKDINLGKKASQVQIDKTGENAYYSVYKAQIEEKQEENGDGIYYCKEGDIFTLNVKNTSKTIGEQLKNFFYTVTGNDTYSIAAQHTVVVLTNGK